MPRASKAHYSTLNGQQKSKSNRVISLIAFVFEDTDYQRAHCNGYPLDMREFDGIEPELRIIRHGRNRVSC